MYIRHNGGPPELTEAEGARLLAAIGASEFGQEFTDYHIAVFAPWQPELMAAVAPFPPTGWRRVVGAGRVLKATSQLRVKLWLRANVGREFGGRRLETDRNGYFYRVVTAVGEQAP